MENTHSTHLTGPKTYLKVLAALVTLTVLTVWAASFDFGSMNVVIALVIATLKASLVALFFMHLLHEKPMNAIIFVAGVVFLGIFLGLSFLDSDTRVENAVRPSITHPVAPGAAAAAKVQK